MSNTDTWSETHWSISISPAQTAKLDGFAVNIASGENLAQLDNFFTAASRYNLKLFFSFDYAGNGPWDKEAVIALINKYKNHAAYFKHGGSKPLASTFEGPDQAGDWGEIKARTGCHFMPDWSSLGAMKAWDKQDGRGARAADGLFNWAAWPEGNRPIDTYVDASYLHFMGGEDNGSNQKYMMPISPWFYTNLPQYKKNWMWKSEDAWYTRWVQILRLQPEYVQIISWNDFGESHYIGPTFGSEVVMEHPDTPYDYTKRMEHTGWLKTLPFWIDMYKTGTATVNKEEVVAWYTRNTGFECDLANTTINTATHLQLEYSPQYLGNFIFYDAILGSDAQVEVIIGGETSYEKFSSIPHGGVGIYHGKAYIGLRTGDVVVRITRKGSEVMRMTGYVPIGVGCDSGGYNNFNAVVNFGDSGKSITAVKPPLKVSDMKCTKGYGEGSFHGICSITCSLGYCPTGACVCTALGAQPKMPEATGEKGYTKGDPSFIGLCDFACNYGRCPREVCSPIPMNIVPPTVSPFLPATCTGGEGKFAGQDKLDALCKFACKYGNCPQSVCECTSEGQLNNIHDSFTIIPKVGGVAVGRWARDMDVSNMCTFTCSFGHCPAGICQSIGGDTPNLPADPYTPDPDDEDYDELCEGTYTSLDALALDAAKIPAACAAKYMLPILMKRLKKATDAYNGMLDNDYDWWFGVYAEYIVSQAPMALKDLMEKHGKDFFTCQVVEPIRCCTTCDVLNKPVSCRKYCIEPNDTATKSTVCTFKTPYFGENNVDYQLVKQPCPPDYSQRGEANSAAGIVWEMAKGKEEAFYQKVLEDVGALKKDIAFPQVLTIGDRPAGCNAKPPNVTDLACAASGVWFNGSVVDSLTPSDIINPKAFIRQAMENANTLVTDLPTMAWRALSDQDVDDEGTVEDLVDAVALPLFMLEDAVGYMQTVVETGKEIQEMFNQMMLLNFLSALFMVIPMMGQLLGAAARPMLAMLGRSMIYAGELGGLGLTIKGVVDDPKSAPWLIFNLVMSGVGIKSAGNNIKAAQIARKMSPDDIKKFTSEKAAANIKKVRFVVSKEKIRKVCDRYA